jgi:hypothetical protein
MYGHLLQMIFSPGSMYADPWIEKDLYPDLALLYSEDYRKLFEEKWRFPSALLRVVGNPQLDPVFQLANASNAKERISNLYKSLGIPLDKPLVVFLVDGLDSGLSSFTDKDWLDELTDVAAAVRSWGGRLVLKLHPTNDRQKVENAFISIPDVHIVQTETDLSIVLGSLAVVGHISSALVIPIALNIPVFIPQWSNVYKDYDYYISNRVALPLDSAEDIGNRLDSLVNGLRIVAEGHNDYVKNHITFLDGNTWQRVENEVVNLCNGKCQI